jgi:DNA topoisomerase-6 subunit B
MIHIASAWVPFTSESKEAIAHYPEIIKEIKLAVQECGRKLASHIRRRGREADEEKKKSYIEKYIPHIGIALKDILGLTQAQERKVVQTLRGTLERSRKL